MGYSRRQEFCCTLEELERYSDVVLYDKEILWVRDAKGMLMPLMGDGVSTVSKLYSKNGVGVIVPDRSIDSKKIGYAVIMQEHLGNALQLDLSRSRLTYSRVVTHEKILTNLEKGYLDDLSATGDMNSVAERTVPYNALPYAEVKKIYGGGYKDGNGLIQPRRALRVESCKLAEREILDATLDLSEMVDTMTVEKLADGSFKFTGYTSSYGDGGQCKFATVNLPKGSYGLTLRSVVQNDDISITANGTLLAESLYKHQVFTLSEDTVVDFYVNSDSAAGGADGAIYFLEIQEGTWSGSDYGGELIPARIPIASLEIPEEVRAIDGYGFSASNYIDLERKVIVMERKNINNTSVLLDKVEEVDVSAYLSNDNLIEVVPNGIIRVIEDTGAIMTGKCEVEFMLKGV